MLTIIPLLTLFLRIQSRARAGSEDATPWLLCWHATVESAQEGRPKVTLTGCTEPTCTEGDLLNQSYSSLCTQGLERLRATSTDAGGMQAYYRVCLQDVRWLLSEPV